MNTLLVRTLLPPLRSNKITLDPDPARLGWLDPVPDDERYHFSELRSRFRREGYLFIRGLFPPETVLEFRKHYFEALAYSGLTHPDTLPEQGIAGPNPDLTAVRHTLFSSLVPGLEYESLCRAPELVAFLEEFLGGPLHLHTRKLIRHQRPDDTWTTPAHYDLVYLRGGTD